MTGKQQIEPTFIGVGGQKCATTWLAECLRAHPEVFLSSPKEIDYFGSRTRGNRSLEWYLSHFSGGADHKAVGEFSTRYLVKPSSREALYEALPEVQIIVSLRDPVARFISAWKHGIRGQVLAKSEFGVVSRETLAKAREVVPGLFSDGLYSPGLKAYLESFGAERVHVVIQDQIKTRPRLVLSGLYRFLGVDPDFVPPFAEKRVSPGIMPRSVFLETLRRKAYRIAKYRFPWLINFGHASGTSDLFRRLNANRENELHLDPAAVEELRKHYRQEVETLRSLLGLGLENW